MLAFAALMLVQMASKTDTLTGMCFSSLVLSPGYLVMVCALAALAFHRNASIACVFASLLFGAMYALPACVVYYAQCTTVRTMSFGEEALAVIGFSYGGSLFGNYDLLSYAFLALSTFFAGCALPRGPGVKTLSVLLRLHGLFFFPCLLLPLTPVFSLSSGTDGSAGQLGLVLWCVYFLAVCVFAWKGFRVLQTDPEREGEGEHAGQTV